MIARTCEIRIRKSDPTVRRSRRMSLGAGPELAKCLRQQRPHIRIVLMSGYTENAVEGNGGIPGGFYIEKPFTRAELMKVPRSTLTA